MLHINALTFRIEGKLIFDGATAGVPAGHKVGLVGRNGAGKTTLLRLIAGELSPDDGAITTSRRNRIGIVAQEAPGGPESLIETVLAADTERAALLAEAETAEDPGRIADIQLRLTDIGAYSAPARAAAILAGLGFDEAAQARPCAEYSGGWRMRVALASALFAAPDILLLDEPTNYLDLEGALWLENFIARYPRTVLIVSHDRDLLNTAVGAILHLERGKLVLYTGGYDDFERLRREKQRLELRLMKRQDEARRHMEAFVERFRYKATKARQAQSRLKALAKLRPIAAQVDERVVPFRFPAPAKPLASPLLRFEGASVGYGAGEPVLTDLDLRIDHDDRIGLLGANGNGKSTFAKLVSGRLDVMSGTRLCSKKLEFGYFAQHQLDELNPLKTPYDHIAELMPETSEAKKRARLGDLGFGADKADTRCANLSGGEKARLLFALATFGGPHILILDEPTNHLDVDSREALIHALNDYEGAVILISHDRHLIETSVDRLWITRGGTVMPYDGDLESYRAECLAERGGRRVAGKGGRKNTKDKVGEPARSDQPDQKSSQRKAADRRSAAERRREVAPLKREMDRAERRVADVTRRLKRFEAELADPDIYRRDPAKAREMAHEHGLLARKLEAAEEAWLAAGEAYEVACGEVAAE